ncbi:MAG: hypothetical protein K2Y27_32040 [Xanthobacteraceae bacterium]|nr:hypothetical protein [Xanthobacteraceae bacterium]
MKMRFAMMSAAAAAVSSVALLSVAFTLAHAQPAKKVNTSVGARTAACKKDCSSGNLHGIYRAYGAHDPQLKSPESRKLYNECVRLCLDPLPTTYVQRSIIESGGSWFGQTKADCLGCHASGKPKRNWPGINTVPDALKRENITN